MKSAMEAFGLRNPMVDGSLEWLSPRSLTTANTISPENRSLGQRSLLAPVGEERLLASSNTNLLWCSSPSFSFDYSTSAALPMAATAALTSSKVWVTIRMASASTAAPLRPRDTRLLRRIDGGNVGTVYLCRHGLRLLNVHTSKVIKFVTSAMHLLKYCKEVDGINHCSKCIT
uniref:Uncharacterized protein n=1 Tax=Zea mays TaxID=4577 RepID=A0A804NNZ6_MAIZE